MQKTETHAIIVKKSFIAIKSSLAVKNNLIEYFNLSQWLIKTAKITQGCKHEHKYLNK